MLSLVKSAEDSWLAHRLLYFKVFSKNSRMVQFRSGEVKV